MSRYTSYLHMSIIPSRQYDFNDMMCKSSADTKTEWRNEVQNVGMWREGLMSRILRQHHKINDFEWGSEGWAKEVKGVGLVVDGL